MRATVHRHQRRWIGAWTKSSGGDDGDGGVGGGAGRPPVTSTSSGWPTPSG